VTAISDLKERKIRKILEFQKFEILWVLFNHLQ